MVPNNQRTESTDTHCTNHLKQLIFFVQLMLIQSSELILYKLISNSYFSGNMSAGWYYKTSMYSISIQISKSESQQIKVNKSKSIKVLVATCPSAL